MWGFRRVVIFSQPQPLGGGVIPRPYHITNRPDKSAIQGGGLPCPYPGSIPIQGGLPPPGWGLGKPRPYISLYSPSMVSSRGPPPWSGGVSCCVPPKSEPPGPPPPAPAWR